ncbi:MAG: glycosyltransferase family 39 protein [Chloroflexi bacterium]|nr:glycosyltransferase family 39 protein [Chloroflexota bacterium]MCI0578944.1 glycosyltransferase family 39 protein [Chloroflexota bacterium]MCI0646881.1 glycosyltransferase family 39 protein [Chloroflexota bacterium]MCI0730801.1 glycosyltransferase family 39 protein [Chloroflexota bacterium]
MTPETPLRLPARLWKERPEVREPEAMQVIVALAGALVSLLIGYAYARVDWVTGWQLWTWLVTVIVVAAVLLSGAGRPPLAPGRHWWWLAALLLAAFVLRAALLEIIPGGLHVDEYGVADFSLRHIFYQPLQTINPFRTGPASQPILYHYLVRLFLAVAGQSITGLRLSSAVAGALGVLATWAMVAVFDNRRTAVFAAVLMAGYHFHLHWSRIGLNNIWDTLWAPLMLAAFAWGWRRRWSGGAVLAGLALGFSQYFYAGSRLGALLLAVVLFQLWREQPLEERDARRLLVHGGKLGLMAVCVAAPLFLFALREPGPFFNRAGVAFGWRPETMVMVTGNPPRPLAYAWYQLWRSAGAFVAVPDVTGFYGPNVPLLIGLAAPLFVIGLLWAIYKGYTLPVLWVALTVLLGGVLLADPPGSSHYVVVIPAICWLVAMPLNWLAENGQRRLAILFLVAIVLTDLAFYFGVYVPSHPRDLIHPFPPWPPG